MSSDRLSPRVDVTDEEYSNYLIERSIPFTHSPFKNDSCPPSRQGYGTTSATPRSRSLLRGRKNAKDIISTAERGRDIWDDDPVGDRPPSWLELSGDIAWTATFSSLTSNTEIVDGMSIVSYGVFFGMMWQLWASQARYDIKFYTNDWWHRIFFILQICTYGGLAAFTSDFDVFWGLRSNQRIFVGNVKELTAEVIAKNLYKKRHLSFMGIALVMAISRCLLLLQYLRVIYYRYKHRVSSWLCMLTPISIAISLILFFACFAILMSVDPSQAYTIAAIEDGKQGKVNQLRPYAIIQLLLWASAMLVELIGHAFTPDDHKDQLRGHGSITERLSTLTVIVMGEGLNGLCSTLRHSVNALGVGAQTVIQLCSVAIILYLYWLLYFDGFRKRLPPKKINKEIWILLHLPFHLFLILMLEGLSKEYLFVQSAVAFLEPSPEMDKVLGKLDMSWEQQILDSKNAISTSMEAIYIHVYRWFLTVVYKMSKGTSDKLDEKVEYMYHNYMTNDTFINEDMDKSGLDGLGYNGQKVLNEFFESIYSGALWIVPVAGVVLLNIGLLNYLQSRPRDPYAWGSFLTKAIGGVVMICLAGFSATTADRLAESVPWFLPIIAIVLSTVVFMNMMLHIIYRWVRTRSSSSSTTANAYTDNQSTEPLIHGQMPMGRVSLVDVSASDTYKNLQTAGREQA
ncbi:hypothetical protein FRC02_004906 [Tulasnella sp. 418]|nr:hypothetical protein FRC02_004906 [Tulasnella sp. 418]